MNYQTGDPIDKFLLGSDEIWFNPGDNHYFYANSMATPPQLGVVDAGPPPSLDLAAAVIGTGSHSVAADSVTNEVYVPIRGDNAVTPAGTDAVCSKGTDAFGLAGSDALGCIMTYIAPTDSDDDPPAKHAKR
jgi:DNA-binding beta-propeller fold protein YncE